MPPPIPITLNHTLNDTERHNPQSGLNHTLNDTLNYAERHSYSRFPMLCINKSKNISTHPLRIYSLKPSTELYRQMSMLALRLSPFARLATIPSTNPYLEMPPSTLERRMNQALEEARRGIPHILDGQTNSCTECITSNRTSNRSRNPCRDIDGLNDGLNDIQRNMRYAMINYSIENLGWSIADLERTIDRVFENVSNVSRTNTQVETSLTDALDMHELNTLLNTIQIRFQ